MPYPITRSDGTLLLNLQEFTRDNSTTSLTLIGRGVVNYGEAMAENLVHLAENFASPTPPANPMEGQTWFHTFNPGPPVTVVNKLKVFNGVEWAVVGGATSSVNPPDNPEPGDMWYNIEEATIYYWDGFNWRKVGGPYTGAEGGDYEEGEIMPPPPNPQEGDLWWMLPERQLWAYDKSLAQISAYPPMSRRIDDSLVPNGWVLVGPVGSEKDGNYIQFTTLINGNDKLDVMKIVVNGELVAIYTNKPFELAENKVDGMDFGTYQPNPGGGGSTNSKNLSPGLNLNNMINAVMTGTATNADLLDGLDSTFFVRKDQSDKPIGTFNLFDLGDFESKWRRFHAIDIYAGESDPDGADDISYVNLHGMATKAEVCDRAEKADMFSAPKNLTTPTTEHVKIDFLNLFDSAANDYNGTAQFTQAGQDAIKVIAKQEADNAVAQIPVGNWVPLDKDSVPTGTFNQGNAGARWGTIFANVFDGEATKARYADLAERYEADATYPAGTLISIGGTKEITITTNENDTNFFGVISENPGFLLNSSYGTNKLPVALQGRVDVRVLGPVKKGDRLVLSSIPGVATVYTGELSELNPYLLIGRSLVDNNDVNEKLVLASVKSH